MRARYEEALARERPDAGRVELAFMQVPPCTAAGTVLYAKALQASGQEAQARDLIRAYWREKVSADDGERTILSNFAHVLSPGDHQARVARLFGQGKTVEAEKAAELLDKESQTRVRAWIAMRRDPGGAAQEDSALPVEEPRDPAIEFARIESLRKSGSSVIAATLMDAAPTDPGTLVDPDSWSAERQQLARDVADYDPSLALDLTSVSPGASSAAKNDIEVDAGRYALRLNRPAEAVQHFQLATSAAAATPEKWSRAEYWLGRAFDAAGRTAEAADHYRDAGRAPTTFYGQLALAKLGAGELRLPHPLAIDEPAEERFRDRELVQAAARLASIGRLEEATLLYRQLAQILTDPAEITLLAEMVADQGDPAFALRIGQVTDVAEAPAQAIAFPIEGVPPLDRHDVELPAVYAVARQESAFRAGAVSSVGAQGLLQLMPATAKEVAEHLGLDYSKDRLGNDPAYNATLGAAFLGSLLAQFHGSYAMSFAAYNAGAGRVMEWAKAHGDPRDPGTDVAEWIESIPIAETRNYVERTLENLQVYRARLGDTVLGLQADLTGQPGCWPDPLATPVARLVVVAVSPRPPARPVAPPPPFSPAAVKPASKTGRSAASRSGRVQLVNVTQTAPHRPGQPIQATRSAQQTAKKRVRRA